jgi:hypothetical protein
MPVSLVGYSGGYEKHKQKWKGLVRWFAEVAIETIHGFAVGTPF